MLNWDIFGGRPMKVEFESILFGLAFLVLVLISLPEQEDAASPSVETAAATQIEGADALRR
jgi:hypothetical protein